MRAIQQMNDTELELHQGGKQSMAIALRNIGHTDFVSHMQL